jgi:ferrous iron transport protein A
MTLKDLKPETSGVIEAIHGNQDLRRRLSGLGMRHGIRVRVVRQSPLNGPMQVRVGHTDLILRRADAANIEITPVA